MLRLARCLHPFDHTGKRRPYTDIPARVTDLADDPYRSLAGMLRAAGGFAKDTSPFADPGSIRERGVTWVTPQLVAEVGFTEWTTAGRLRHPRFQGLRDDKAATDVVRER